jgi:hypothetical protein
MKWYGLNWTDIVINVAVLAILPGLLGALGGHLAAEGLQEQTRRRSIKVIFWAMCVVWVFVTFWQQFRAAEADLDRATKDAWAQTLATSKFPPPSPPANIERWHGGTKRTEAALEFAGRGQLQLLMADTTAVPAEKPKYWFEMTDATNCFTWPGKPEDCQPLPLVSQTYFNDYINAESLNGPYGVLESSPSEVAKQHVKEGDVIIGYIGITCINCFKPRKYYVYFKVGHGGWFYPVPAGIDLISISSNIRTVPDPVLDQFFDKNFPRERRIAIPEQFDYKRPTRLLP